MRGEGTPMPPTDPMIYRFYEMVMVNGPAWKALVEEEYGDGIGLAGGAQLQGHQHGCRGCRARRGR
jgi:cyanate lyase